MMKWNDRQECWVGDPELARENEEQDRYVMESRNEWMDEAKEKIEILEGELGNMTEALRQVNARLVEMTAERDALAARLAAMEDDGR